MQFIQIGAFNVDVLITCHFSRSLVWISPLMDPAPVSKGSTRSSRGTPETKVRGIASRLIKKNDRAPSVQIALRVIISVYMSS